MGGRVYTLPRFMHSNSPVYSKTLGNIPRQPALRTSHPSRHITRPLKALPSPTKSTSPVKPFSVTSKPKNFASPTNPVTSNTTHTKFQYPYIPTYGRPQYAYAAQSLLQTVDIKIEDLKNWAILDSGATSHFLVTDAPVIDILPASRPLTVQIPNGERVTLTHTCNLDMPHLPQKA